MFTNEREAGVTRANLPKNQSENLQADYNTLRFIPPNHFIDRGGAPHFSPSGRVTPKRKCPICGRPRWCTISDDGRFAICMWISSGAVKDTRNQGYLHVLDGARRAPINIEPTAVTPIAPIEKRDRINRALLASLKLNPRHRDDVRRRGLDDIAIERGLFRSMPSCRAADQIASHLGWEFGGLAGTPGFYFAAGDWRMVTGEWWRGYLVPVMDPAGRIEGCQIRRDDDSTGPRYVWFSSAKWPKDRPNGCGAHAWPHFVRPERLNETNTILVSEGSLKITIASHLLDVAGVGLAGVLSFGEDFGHKLAALFPDLKKAILAFDVEIEKEARQAVERATLKMGRSLQDAGLGVEVWGWGRAEGKGVDDYLVNLAGREMCR